MSNENMEAHKLKVAMSASLNKSYVVLEQEKDASLYKSMHKEEKPVNELESKRKSLLLSSESQEPKKEVPTFGMERSVPLNAQPNRMPEPEKMIVSFPFIKAHMNEEKNKLLAELKFYKELATKHSNLDSDSANSNSFKIYHLIIVGVICFILGCLTSFGN